jgi:site-specific recombinase XerD
VCLKIFPNAEIEAKHRNGLFGVHLDCFLNWMEEHGYSRKTMRSYACQVARLGRYLKKRGIRSIHELEEEPGQKLLISYQRYWKARGCYHRNFGPRLYFRALEDAGVFRASPPKNSHLFHETRLYAAFLENQKGLSESTVLRHIRYTEKFLEFIGCQKDVRTIPGFGIAELDNFIKQEGIRLGRTSQQLVAATLRSFVSFLYQSGKIGTDLSYFITSPRCYKLESLPRPLSWDDVGRLLRSVDLSTGSGVRACAILTLLISYGLRSGEVAHLRLEDIDWRRETIHIARQKTGRDLWLPLIPQAAEALIRYLKRGRPSSKYREVFLLARAPWTPINSQNIGQVVRRQIHLAGLTPSSQGAHIIRHSFATHLHRKGASLKEVGDMLGHRTPQSTHVYTKTATDHLRDVALEVPEVPDEK